MSEHREFEELVALDALDALDVSDRALLDAHLASGCEQCVTARRDAKRVADELLQAAAPSTPSASVGDALMARIESDRPEQNESPAESSSLWPVLAAAAAVVVALALGIYTRSLESSLAEETARRRAAEAETERLRESFTSVTSPRNRAVSLDGLDAAPSARATAFLDPENGRLFLYVENLPTLSPEQTYQIWLLVDGAPVSVGTFDVATDGSARLDDEPLPAFEGTVSVAVTVEPAGGVPAPTGPMVLLGS